MIFIVILFHTLYGLSSNSICPQQPLCDCRPNTGMFDIYCVNLTTLEPVTKLLHEQFNSSIINKLMFMANCNLTTLPNHAFENISISVFMANCPFSDISEYAFRGTKGLTKIDLKNTIFVTIPIGLLNLKILKTLNFRYSNFSSLKHELWNLSSLLFIRFSDGVLEELSEDAFEKTPDIQYLDLSYNRLRYVYPDTIKSLVTLQRINLRGNQISNINGLFQHINPQVIDLYDNNLTSLDNVFRLDMWNLKSLNIGKNPINYLNSSAFRSMFRNLEIFDMSATKCTEIDPHLFHFFPKLKQALLGRNRLQNIPKALFHNLKGLEVIDLTGNNIDSVEGCFQNIRNIKRLFLSRNKISEIGNSFSKSGGMEQLEKLYLSRNKISHLSNDNFKGLKRLQYLILSHNNIRYIESKSFSELQNLVALELSSNYFDQFNKSLQGLFSLKELWIRSINLRTIDHNEFWGLTKLRYLNTVDNGIKSLNGVFRDLRSLEELNIAKNKLTTLSRDTFPEKMKLEKLWISRNKLQCDCRLAWMIRWLKHVNYTVLLEEPLCHLPLRLRGKPLRLLTIKDVIVWPENCPPYCQCECIEQGWNFYIKVDCSHRNLTRIPHVLPQHLGDLDMSGNELVSFIDPNPTLTYGLIHLNLENNKISSLESDLPENLTRLRLAGNLLTQLFFSKLPNDTLKEITLANNPWTCDCETTVNFRKWLLSEGNIIVDVNDTKCGNGPLPKLYGEVITALKDTDLCPSVLSLFIALAIGLLCALLLVTSMVLAYSRYKLYIKVWLYAHGYTWVKEDDLDTGKLFDALVSYHRNDEDFVFTEIVPSLEWEVPKFTLCIPQRDFVCGEFETATTLKAVTDSKRIIVILTQEYMNDASCMSIFQQAFEQSLEDKVHRVILVKLEEIPKTDDINSELKITMDSTDCICWGDRLFWERLRYAMPKKMTHYQKVLVNNRQVSPETEAAANTNADDDSDAIHHRG